MVTSEKFTAVYAAIAEVQGKCSPVGMSGRNTYDGYDYAKLEDFVAVVRPLMADSKLGAIMNIDKIDRLPDRQTSKGGVERPVQVTGRLRIVHFPSGEWVDVPCYGEGQDRGDKALYKAITGARKYGLACAFGLATGDDPENDADAGKQDGKGGKGGNERTPAKPPAPKLTTAADTFVNNFTKLAGERRCKPAKAQAVLNQVMQKKGTHVNDLSEDECVGILSKVKEGGWDKAFGLKEQPPAEGAK